MVNESCLKQIKPLLHGGPDYPTEIKFGKNGCCCATGYNFRVGANGNIINYQCTKMTSCIDSEYYERFGIGFPKFLTSSGHEKIGVSGWISEKIEGQELILLHPTNCRFKYGNACFKGVTRRRLICGRNGYTFSKGLRYKENNFWYISTRLRVRPGAARFPGPRR